MDVFVFGILDGGGRDLCHVGRCYYGGFVAELFELEGGTGAGAGAGYATLNAAAGIEACDLSVYGGAVQGEVLVGLIYYKAFSIIRKTLGAERS